MPSSGAFTNASRSRGSPQVGPDLFALQVRLQPCVSVTPEVGDIEAVYGNTELLGQQLQGQLTGQVLQGEGGEPANEQTREVIRQDSSG